MMIHLLDFLRDGLESLDKCESVTELSSVRMTSEDIRAEGLEMEPVGTCSRVERK